MISDLDICLPDILRKERCNAVCHLIQHRTHTPPVCLPPVPFARGRDRRVGIGHLEGHENLLVHLEDFRRDIVARADGDQAVIPRDALAPVGLRCQERCGRAEVDQEKVRRLRQNKIVWLDVSDSEAHQIWL